jgi:hypothetical protein
MLSNNAIIIGVVVVLVVIVAAYYFMSPATDDDTTTPPAPTAHSTPAASGTTYTYVVDADVAKTGKYWDAAAANVYKCPTGYTTKTAGYCILPTTSAAAACSTDTKCLGYLTSSGDPNYAQLTTGIGPSDLTGVTYYRKTKST